jgi:Holliday junction resolvase-like predicted endonuclease
MQSGQKSSENIAHNYTLARQGENLVCRFYEAGDYKLIARNFYWHMTRRGGKMGEIDLIFEKNNKLFLVEVKTREVFSVAKYGQAIVRSKQIKAMSKTFEYFLLQFPKYKNHNAQYDIARVVQGKVQVIPNATSFDTY